MREYELPTNVKQIGSISDGLRIYVEDYAYTFMKQYAEDGGYSERIGFLIGSYIIIDSQPVVFINGAIEGRYTEYRNNIEMFTEKSFLYAEEQIDKYFKGCEIVGWLQSQPGYSVFLNPVYAEYHLNNFKKPYQSLFVIDPAEKTNLFYSWNDEMTGLTEESGYFVYYDKNVGMQEYMLENKVGLLEMKEKDAKIRRKKPEETQKEKELNIVRPSFRDKPKTTNPPARKSNQQLKRPVAMLTALVGVMFAATFFLAANLFRSNDKLTKLEEDISHLSASYVYMQNQFKTGVQPVFASAPDEETETADIEEIDTAETNSDQSNDMENVNADNNDNEETAIINEETDPQEQADVTENDDPQAAEPDTEQSGQVVNINDSNEVAQGENSADSAVGVVETPDIYIVQEGDNLNYISQKIYGTTDMKEAIMELNDITDPNTIYFGKELKLPKITN